MLELVQYLVSFGTSLTSCRDIFRRALRFIRDVTVVCCDLLSGLWAYSCHPIFWPSSLCGSRTFELNLVTFKVSWCHNWHSCRVVQSFYISLVDVVYSNPWSIGCCVEVKWHTIAEPSGVAMFWCQFCACFRTFREFVGPLLPVGGDLNQAGGVSLYVSRFER